MTSITKKIHKYLDKVYPDVDIRQTLDEFPTYPTSAIKTAYYRYINSLKLSETIEIRTELIKIIKDYKQPASARVQAIREYNNLIEKEPDKTGEDPLLKLLTTLEKES